MVRGTLAVGLSAQFRLEDNLIFFIITIIIIIFM